MKTKIYVPAIVLVFFVASIFLLLFNQGINAQNQGNDTINKPDVHISVNKKTDEKGNITEYDSTYSYSYSTHSNNEKDIDSIMRNFQNDFNFKFFNGKMFRDNSKDDIFSISPFGNDSTFSHFQNIDKILKAHMEAMMQEQDKMMKMFFNDGFFNNEPVLKVPEEAEPNDKKVTPAPKNESFKPTLEI
jgi:hypothetical protein